MPRDPDATFRLRFTGGVEAWSVPAGEWEFEVLGTEGSIRSVNNGTGVTLRPTTGAPRRPAWSEQPFPLPEPVSPAVACLEDLVAAHESGRPTLSPVDLSVHIVEACIAVAESHRRGGAWVELPLAQRDLYIFHV